jgi:hypothetical protein
MSRQCKTYVIMPAMVTVFFSRDHKILSGIVIFIQENSRRNVVAIFFVYV